MAHAISAARLLRTRGFWINVLDVVTRHAPSAGATIAAIYLISAGLRYFVDPSSITRTPVGQAVQPFTTVWETFYVGGGLLVLLARWRAPLLELAGLALLITGWCMNFVAYLTAIGFDLGGLLYVLLVVWGCGRLATVIRQHA